MSFLSVGTLGPPDRTPEPHGFHRSHGCVARATPLRLLDPHALLRLEVGSNAGAPLRGDDHDLLAPHDRLRDSGVCPRGVDRRGLTLHDLARPSMGCGRRQHRVAHPPSRAKVRPIHTRLATPKGICRGDPRAGRPTPTRESGRDSPPGHTIVPRRRLEATGVPEGRAPRSRLDPARPRRPGDLPGAPRPDRS